MGRAFVRLLAGLSILMAMVGCALCPHGRRCHSCCPSPKDEIPLPSVERNDQESPLLELSASLLPAEPMRGMPSSSDYRSLAPQLCQCLAAKHAPLADGMERQRQQLQNQRARACSVSGQKSDKQRAFQESMLLYSALEIRDQAAGTALEWYYQLAGAEAKADLLTTSLLRGRDTLERVERLKKLGIPLPAPIEEYQRQIVELKLQQAQNQLSIEQLNSKLRLALGYDAMSPWRFLPDASVTLNSETVPDVDAAIALGLAQRPQLLLLRSMIANLDVDTLGSARSLLQSISPLLAMSSPGPSCKLLILLGKLLHIHPGQDDEVERVRAQLVDYLHERERTVIAEIREAAYEVGARREATILARETVERWQERIRDLEKKHAQGMPVFADLTRAYMDSYKARGEVIRELLGWKIAAVKLKQAQGILPAECGYTECDK
jgi:hypothetical protein